MGLAKFTFVFIALFVDAIESQDQKSVCYGVLGCFNISPDFQHLLYRPINVLPENPKNFNTKLTLYRRSNREKGHNVPQKWITTDKASDKLDHFDGSKETKFIVHGYIDGPHRSNWAQQMKNELLSNKDYNVFYVDWSESNQMPYTQAVANSRVVAAQIALFIRNLNSNHGLNNKQVHLIGHSLGAHLVGYTGSEFAKTSTKIGRITGLDPAEPFFQYMPESVRLDRMDAQFVDVIHTDSRSILQGGAGMSQAIGHIDFFANGGYDQPGCTTDKRILSIFTSGLQEGARQLVGCNHFRAIQYFTESINSKNCQFLGYHCDNWTKFSSERGCTSCGKNKGLCAYMGYRAIEWKKFKSNKKSKIFYTRTNGDNPFCGYQYKIEVPIQATNSSETYSGTIDLKLISGSKHVSIGIETQNITSGTSHYAIVSSPDKQFLNSLTSIELKWYEDQFDVFRPDTWKFGSFFGQNSDSNAKTNRVLFIKRINVRPLQIESRLRPKRFCNNTKAKDVTEVIRFNKVC